MECTVSAILKRTDMIEMIEEFKWSQDGIEYMNTVVVYISFSVISYLEVLSIDILLT